jgi:hypothetical protein
VRPRPCESGRSPAGVGGLAGGFAQDLLTLLISVSDSGVHLIAWIMIGVSLALVLIFVLDRTLPARTGYQAT